MNGESNLIYSMSIFMTGFDYINLQKPTYCGLGGASVGLTQIPYIFGQSSKHDIKPEEDAIWVLRYFTVASKG